MSIPAAASRQSPFERHPRVTLLAIWLVLLILLASVGEIVARITTPYDMGFYAFDKEARSTVLTFPYGEIPVNKFGFADVEFDLASIKPRIGYFGDSVNLGVGAGWPNRFSDYMKAAYPAFEHWNIGGGLDADVDSNELARYAKEFKLSYAVYLMNLNDIHPMAAIDSTSLGGTLVYRLTGFVRDNLDYLRYRSYLYNRIRTAIKTIMTRWGFEASGYYAFELWPEKYDDVFKLTASRLNQQVAMAEAAGVKVCVVLLPYEMQISRDAAATYAKMGFQWESGFTAGSAQERMARYITPSADVFNPLAAFAPFDGKVGRYFVYNRGDKVDWNHPNGEGHRIIADAFMRGSHCGFLHEGVAG